MTSCRLAVEDAALKRAKRVVPGSPRSLVVLTFANYDYRATLVNWMAGLHRLGVTNFEVVCMDDQISEFMTSIGRPCASLMRVHRGPGRYSGVWELRVRVLAGLLEKGTDVVFSDSDAIWLQNPFQFLATGDIVASRDNFPMVAMDKLGCAACMGFAFFRGTPDVARFAKDQIMGHFTGDDQETLNKALIANGLSFKPKARYYSNTVSEGKAGNLTVKFLGHSDFRRICNLNWTGVYVAHCQIHKGGAYKTRFLMEKGLWFLKEGWEEAPNSTNFTAWISNISTEPYVARPPKH